VNRFWYQERKCVESEATAVDPAPHSPSSRTTKVALAISVATALLRTLLVLTNLEVSR
jgi:hypothetical protein